MSLADDFPLNVCNFTLRSLRLCEKQRYFMGGFSQRREGAKIAKKECSTKLSVL